MRGIKIMKKNINEKICEFRKARGLTQEQLGLQLGISGQAVSKWEKGESLPDILLLPELCDILGMSVDALLEMPVSVKNKNIMQDFSAYAREKGNARTMLDALSRTFNDAGNPIDGKAVSFSPKSISISDSDGMGFILNGEKRMKDTLEFDTEQVAYILRLLSNEDCLKILKCTSIDKAVTRDEIIEITKLDFDMVSKLLLGLMKRGIIICEKDHSGKRGYLHNLNMTGVYMILEGCRTMENFFGMTFFSREKFSQQGN